MVLSSILHKWIVFFYRKNNHPLGQAPRPYRVASCNCKINTTPGQTGLFAEFKHINKKREKTNKDFSSNDERIEKSPLWKSIGRPNCSLEKVEILVRGWPWVWDFFHIFLRIHLKLLWVPPRVESLVLEWLWNFFHIFLKIHLEFLQTPLTESILQLELSIIFENQIFVILRLQSFSSCN